MSRNTAVPRHHQKHAPPCSSLCYASAMHVEKLKYIIWAQDMGRAIAFYRNVFDGEVVRESEIMGEVVIAGSTIGIHSGGEGKRTWTGLSFQVPDLFAACD